MRKTILGLVPGENYVLQYRSTDGDNFSDYSQAVRFRTVGDIMAPAAILNLAWVATGDSFIGTWNKVTTEADGDPLKDFAYYEVTVSAVVNFVTRTKVFTTNTEQFELTLPMNFAAFGQIAITTTIMVRAVDTTGNKGVASSVTTTEDTPPVPSTPVVSTNLGQLIIAWDGKTASGTITPYNFSHVEIHASTTNNFTPTPATSVARFEGTFAGAQKVPLPGLSSFGTLVYIKLVAVNKMGRNSAPSAQASGTPTRVSGLDIQGGTISTDQINFVDQLGGGKAYYQTSFPATGMKEGDTFFDTDDGYHLYIYNNGQWREGRDTTIAAADTKAGQAFTAANGKNRVFVSGTTPTATPFIDGDTWYDTANGNQPKVFKVGTGWVSARDANIAAVDGRVTTAQQTADNKNKVTYSLSLPGSAANTAGDIWFQKDANNLIIAQFEGTGGTTWVAKTIASAVIANLDAGKITTGTLDAGRIATNSITIGMIKSGDVATPAQVTTVSNVATAASVAADAAQLSQTQVTNPIFSKWTGTWPDGYASWSSTTTANTLKETTIKRTSPNSVRFNVPDTATQMGLSYTSALTSPLPAATEYIVVEVEFQLVSGTLSGSGVVIDWAGGTTGRQQISFSTEVSSPALNQWYRIEKVLQRPTAATGNTAINGFIMANWTTLGGAAKNLVVDRLSLRSATAEEISTLSWRTPGQTTIAGGMITTDTVDALQIKANAVTAVKIAAGAVNTSKLTVAASAQDNLVINGGFSDLDASNLPVLWTRDTVSPYAGATYAISTTAADIASGSTSFRMNSVANSGARIYMTNSVPAAAGDKIAVAGWFKGAGAYPESTAVHIQVFCYTATDGFITTLSGVSGPITTAHTQLAGQITLPANTARIRLGVLLSSTTSARTIWVSDVEMRHATNAVRIEDGAIIAEKIATDAVITRTIKAGAITADTVGTNQIITASANIGQAVIDAANIGSINANVINAGTIKSTQNVIIDGSTYPAFEIAMNGNATFNNGLFRGLIMATGGTFSGNIESSANINGGSFNFPSSANVAANNYGIKGSLGSSGLAVVAPATSNRIIPIGPQYAGTTVGQPGYALISANATGKYIAAIRNTQYPGTGNFYLSVGRTSGAQTATDQLIQQTNPFLLGGSGGTQSKEHVLSFIFPGIGSINLSKFRINNANDTVSVAPYKITIDDFDSNTQTDVTGQTVINAPGSNKRVYMNFNLSPIASGSQAVKVYLSLLHNSDGTINTSTSARITYTALQLEQRTIPSPYVATDRIFDTPQLTINAKGVSAAQLASNQITVTDLSPRTIKFGENDFERGPEWSHLRMQAISIPNGQQVAGRVSSVIGDSQVQYGTNRLVASTSPYVYNSYIGLTFFIPTAPGLWFYNYRGLMTLAAGSTVERLMSIEISEWSYPLNGSQGDPDPVYVKLIDQGHHRNNAGLSNPYRFQVSGYHYFPEVPNYSNPGGTGLAFRVYNSSGVLASVPADTGAANYHTMTWGQHRL